MRGFAFLVSTALVLSSRSVILDYRKSEFGSCVERPDANLSPGEVIKFLPFPLTVKQ
jgi:hypothetical protein